MVEPRTGSEQIRDDIIKFIHFTDKGTEDQRSLFLKVEDGLRYSPDRVPGF